MKAAGLFVQRVEDPADPADAARGLGTGRTRPARRGGGPAGTWRPPKVGAKQAAGFSLSLAKAVLDGCGAEVADLARTNLLR